MTREGWEDFSMDPFGFRSWEKLERERKRDSGLEGHQKLISYIVYRHFPHEVRRSPVRSPRLKGSL